MNGKSGLGVYSASAPGALEAIRQTGARLVLLSDTALELAREARQQNSGILIIGRKWFEYQDIPLDFSLAYNYGMAIANQLPVARFPEVNAWQSFNEYLTNESPDEVWQAANAFELGFTDQMHRLGKKAVILNLAVGNGLPEQLRFMRPSLAKADFLGYHGYASPDGDVDAWYTFRFTSWIYDYQKQGWRGPPVILTESGTYWPNKHCSQYPPGQCKSFTMPEMAKLFSEIDQSMRTLDCVVGSAAFCYHHSETEWDGFNLAEEGRYYPELFASFNQPAVKPWVNGSEEKEEAMPDYDRPQVWADYLRKKQDWPKLDKIALENNLGPAMGGEYDRGKWRLKDFVGGIAFAEINNWENNGVARTVEDQLPPA